MIDDSELEALLDYAPEDTVQRLVNEVRSHRRVIARLRGALEDVHKNIVRGPVYLQEVAHDALAATEPEDV